MSLSSLRKLLAHRDPSQAVFPTSCALAAAVALFLPAAANAATCPNEQFRTGRSASLPDCRAFELVTPEHVDRAGGDLELLKPNLGSGAVASSDGEHLALRASGVFFEPGSVPYGTEAVFSRTGAGWVTRPLAAPGIEAESFKPEVLSPDFSQVGFLSVNGRVEGGGGTLLAGPVGGPYSTIASVPAEGRSNARASFAGANGGVPGAVGAFSDLVIESVDHSLLPAGPEREAAEQTEEGRKDLYEWAGGRLRLLNVDNEGKLLNPCGAILGEEAAIAGNAANAVSADGSRVFFITPQGAGAPGCSEPQLYMRVGGSETVDVSEPEEVSVPPSERGRVGYAGASADGSRVFFTTGTALTPGAGAGFHLYEYATQAPAGHRLTLIANEIGGFEQRVENGFVVSQDGSAVYYRGTSTVEEQGHPVSVTGWWRYDTTTARRSFVAETSAGFEEPSAPPYATPDGRFLVFSSGGAGVRIVGSHGLEVEPRGGGQRPELQQLYRYDAADGSVMCVSCGPAHAPAKGWMLVPESFYGLLTTGGSLNAPVSISDDGRRVFFQTSAQLVPQDTNADTPEEESSSALFNMGSAADVYEWLADGSEEAPGVFCGVVVGCTHLISAGEAVGAEKFLGASRSGRDVFLSSAAQLAPQAPPGFTSIYDARVDGGFPGPTPIAECTSCQGVGSVPPQFGPGASGTFIGAGNSPVAGAPASAPAPAPAVKPKPKARCRRGYKRNRRGRCVRAIPRRAGGR